MTREELSVLRPCLGGAVALLAVLFVIGCGTGGESASNAPSKAAFLRQATAICEARSADIEAMTQPILRLASKISRYTMARKLAEDVARPGLRREILNIRALVPPEGDRDELEAIFSATEAAIDQAVGHPTSNRNPYIHSEALAAKYGLHACGHP